MTDTVATGPPPLSLVLIQLFKGPLYRDTHDKLWDPLLKLRSAVSDHVAVLGLRIEIDEGEGYAFLRSRPGDDDVEFPRLVARRTLPFHVSLLLALLRKRLLEFDASSSDPRLVVSLDDIVQMLRVFLPESSNDAKLTDSLETHVNKVVELGFLRRLRSDPNQYEVRRIIKAFVDGQWLADFDRALDEYLDELRSERGPA